ncbi:MAG TPA: deoxyribose-phosphate aldolase [archaeon]|nr:deoxyribose-phosphate aldolase [archaeon]
MTDNNLVKIKDLTPKQIASICDHTFLHRPEAYREKTPKGQNPIKMWEDDFNNFLKQAVNRSLMPYSICVRPENCEYVRDFLDQNGKKEIVLAATVGFPYPSHHSTKFKVFEAELAIDHGAKEIDMVLDYEKLKKGDIEYVKNDVNIVTWLAHERKAVVKLILETSELNIEQIKHACKIADECNVDFVKTSTGFSAEGAKIEHVKIMKENFSKGVKISGFVNVDNVKELLKAASGREDGYIDLDPMKVRIGESSLLKALQQ